MNSQVTIESVPFFSDGRGWVVEPVGESHLARQRNVHVVFSEPGAVRGNHYHRHCSEILVVPGPGLVRLREGNALRDVEVPTNQMLRFTIPPGVAHAVQNTGTRPMVLMSFATEPHNRAQPDTVPDPLIG